MFAQVSPLVIGTAAVVAAMAVAAIAGMALGGQRIHHDTTDARLPAGADAALWSIVEAVPDPRNHLALTRDLSGEVRLTSGEQATARRLFGEPVQPEPAPIPGRGWGGIDVVELREPILVEPRQPILVIDKDVTGRPTKARRIRTVTDDLDQVDEREQTAEFFFAGEPQLSRF